MSWILFMMGAAVGAAADDFAPESLPAGVLTFAGFDAMTFTVRADGSMAVLFSGNGQPYAPAFGAKPTFSYMKGDVSRATFVFYLRPYTRIYELTFSSSMGGTYTGRRTGFNEVPVGEGVFTVTPLPLLPVANASTRVEVAAGKSGILGFVVKEHGLRYLLFRAAGPALNAFGFPNAMKNPRLRLYRGDELVAENRDWTPPTGDAYYGQEQADLERFGAFPFAAGSKDALVLLSVPTLGNYTAVVDDEDGGSGEVLIEAYAYR